MRVGGPKRKNQIYLKWYGWSQLPAGQKQPDFIDLQDAVNSMSVRVPGCPTYDQSGVGLHPGTVALYWSESDDKHQLERELCLAQF